MNPDSLTHLGFDLREVLQIARTKGRLLGTDVAIAVTVQACDALAALHAADIVHGDLRPERIVVSGAGAVTVGGILPRDVEKGVAIDPEAPEDPELQRWLRYIAPEQALGTRPGAASDVWALAVIASELVAGEHPIPSHIGESVEIMRAVLAGLAPPGSVPAAIHRLLVLALDREPARRPSAAALRKMLVDAAPVARIELGAEVIARRLAELAPLARDKEPSHEPPVRRAPCWCVHLAAGLEPEAPSEELVSYVRGELVRERALFATTQHFGDVDLRRCARCGGAVLHLLVEHEGFTGSIHHYYTALTMTDEAALAAGTLDGDSYEDWAGDRCGIYVASGKAMIYRRARIGYLGIDHRLLP